VVGEVASAAVVEDEVALATVAAAEEVSVVVVVEEVTEGVEEAVAVVHPEAAPSGLAASHLSRAKRPRSERRDHTPSPFVQLVYLSRL